MDDEKYCRVWNGLIWKLNEINKSRNQEIHPSSSNKGTQTTSTKTIRH